MSKCCVNVTIKNRWWLYPVMALAAPFIAMRLIDSRTVANWLAKHAVVYSVGNRAVTCRRSLATWKAMQSGPTGMADEIKRIGARKPAE